MDEWPNWRFNHAGTILSTGHGQKFLIINGGTNIDDTLDDCWIFDISRSSWKKVHEGTKVP